MIKAVIFDFDGVIVESNNIKRDAFGKLFEKEGAEVVRKVIKYHLEHAGVSRYDKFKYIYKEILKKPLTNDEFNALCRQFSELVMESVILALFVEGAREFLEKNRSVYSFFILSATPVEELKAIIDRKNIGQFFKNIYGAPFKKRDAVREILIKEKSAPSEVLYVGDALSDYKAARDNKVNFIARISGNDFVFKGIECVSVKDLTGLDEAISELLKKEV